MNDRTLRVYDTVTGQLQHKITFESQITSIIFSSTESTPTPSDQELLVTFGFSLISTDTRVIILKWNDFTVGREIHLGENVRIISSTRSPFSESGAVILACSDEVLR